MRRENEEKWVVWVKVGCTHFLCKNIGENTGIWEWVVLFRERYSGKKKTMPRQVWRCNEKKTLKVGGLGESGLHPLFMQKHWRKCGNLGVGGTFRKKVYTPKKFPPRTVVAKARHAYR
jgi:hypothetical protein